MKTHKNPLINIFY